MASSKQWSTPCSSIIPPINTLPSATAGVPQLKSPMRRPTGRCGQSPDRCRRRRPTSCRARKYRAGLSPGRPYSWPPCHPIGASLPRSPAVERNTAQLTVSTRWIMRVALTCFRRFAALGHPGIHRAIHVEACPHGLEFETPRRSGESRPSYCERFLAGGRGGECQLHLLTQRIRLRGEDGARV